MNPEWIDYPFVFQGLLAEECEHDQVNGEYFVPQEKACKCGNYKPQSRRLRQAAQKWLTEHGIR